MKDWTTRRRQLQRGLVLHQSDGITRVVSITIDDGLITSIDTISNPDKLTGVQGP